jgi:PRTRC genetic system protein B
LSLSFVDIDGSWSAPPSLRGAVLLYGSSTQGFLMWCDHHDGTLGLPRAINDAQVNAFVEALTGVARRWVSPRTLAVSNGELLWWTPARRRVVYFQTSDPFLNTLSGRSFPVPPLVWQYATNTRALNLWALERDERPTPGTALLRSPFFNVTNASVCLGTTAMPAQIDEGNIDALEDAFFASAFTHVAQSTLHEWGGSPGEFWASIEHAASFPAQHLVPLNVTLTQAVEAASRRA